MKLITLVVMLSASSLVFAEELSFRDVREAIRSNNTDLIKELTKDGKRLRGIFSGESVGVAELAIIFDREEILSQILAEYMFLDQDDLNKALSIACATNLQSRSAIEKLLAKGADINALIRGQNCAYSAVVSADQEFYKFLLSKGADPDQEVIPDKELDLPEKATIRELIEHRIGSYRSMKESLTNKDR